MIKFNLTTFFYFLLMLISPTYFSGCSISHIIETSDINTLQTGTPLQRLPPKTFILRNFNDTRGVDASFFYKNPVHVWKMDKPAANVVTHAIRNELERNGHKFVTDKVQSGVDFIIEGTVYKFGSFDDVKFFTSKGVVEIAVKLTIVSIANNKKVFVKNYEGESHYESGLPGGPTYVDMIDEAQTAMLKELVTDLELISFIENN